MVQSDTAYILYLGTLLLSYCRFAVILSPFSDIPRLVQQFVESPCKQVVAEVIHNKRSLPWWSMLAAYTELVQFSSCRTITL